MATAIEDKLKQDIVSAMKARDKQLLAVLRMLQSELKNASIEQKRELHEEEVIRILQSYAKKREDGAVEMRKAGREELAKKEETELEIVKSYLPEQMGDEELDAVVAKVVEAQGASGPRDMGPVIKAVLAEAQGRADGSRVSAAVKRKLVG